MQEGGSVSALLGQGPEADGRGEDGADILLRLHGAAQLPEERGVLPIQLNQLLHLVAEEQEGAARGAQLAPEPRERVEEVSPLDLAGADADARQPLLGIEQGVAEAPVQLFGVIRPLEIPED